MIQIQFRLAVVAGSVRVEIDTLTREDTTSEERILSVDLLDQWQLRMNELLDGFRPLPKVTVTKRTCGQCATKDMCKIWKTPGDAACPFVAANSPAEARRKEKA